jgi:acylphosphatase
MPATPPEPKLARRFVVHGRVQGVGYRWFAQHAASALGVRGWVRNRDDGTVEVHAQGNGAQLDDLAGLLHRGPRFSDVRHVEVSEAPLVKSSGFDIKY